MIESKDTGIGILQNRKEGDSWVLFLRPFEIPTTVQRGAATPLSQKSVIKTCSEPISDNTTSPMPQNISFLSGSFGLEECLVITLTSSEHGAF